MDYFLIFLWALGALWKHKTISRTNRLRLWRKSANLFWSFLAFTDKDRPQLQLKNAMICALGSALYDYETDWNSVARIEGSLFEAFLYRHVANSAARLLFSQLFSRDLHGKLSRHGLERGSDALLFYHLVIASNWMAHYSVDEIREFGRTLQILDDLLDLEEDIRNGHQNCFRTTDAKTYGEELERFLGSEFFRQLAEHSIVYLILKQMCLHRLGKLSIDPTQAFSSS
jgi:hypothetical protein